MNTEAIITAIIGVFTTAASSFITWLLSKRKYNAEVDNNVINNLQQSVETYKIIVNDLTISKPCYINANGSTFTGTVTIPKEVEVIIENATFSNPVIVA